MKKLLMTAVFTLFVSASLYAKKDINILIVTGGHDYEEKEFYEMFNSMEGVTYTHVEHPSAQDYFNKTKAAPYDALVFYDMGETISDENAQGLLDLIKGGKSLLVFHHAICGYNDWPEFVNLAGGKYFKRPFINPETGKPQEMGDYKHDVKLELSAVKGNGAVTMTPVTYAEERYYNMYIKPDVKPILVFKEANSGQEAVAAWENKYGKGTVITFLPGHDHQFFNNPELRSSLEQTIKYLAKKSK